MTDEQLKVARIILKDAAAKRARLEWRTKGGDSDALSARQLTQEIINNGNEASLDSLAKYFDVHIRPRKQDTDTFRQNPDGSFTCRLSDGSYITLKVEKI